jgi:hypothetical protein
VAARQRFVENAAADMAAGAEQDQFHVGISP